MRFSVSVLVGLALCAPGVSASADEVQHARLAAGARATVNGPGALGVWAAYMPVPLASFEARVGTGCVPGCGAELPQLGAVAALRPVHLHGRRWAIEPRLGLGWSTGRFIARSGGVDYRGDLHWLHGELGIDVVLGARSGLVLGLDAGISAPAHESQMICPEGTRCPDLNHSFSPRAYLSARIGWRL